MNFLFENMSFRNGRVTPFVDVCEIYRRAIGRFVNSALYDLIKNRLETINFIFKNNWIFSTLISSKSSKFFGFLLISN